MVDGFVCKDGALLKWEQCNEKPRVMFRFTEAHRKFECGKNQFPYRFFFSVFYTFPHWKASQSVIQSSGCRLLLHYFPFCCLHHQHAPVAPLRRAQHFVKWRQSDLYDFYIGLTHTHTHTNSREMLKRDRETICKEYTNLFMWSLAHNKYSFASVVFYFHRWFFFLFHFLSLLLSCFLFSTHEIDIFSSVVLFFISSLHETNLNCCFFCSQICTRTSPNEWGAWLNLLLCLFIRNAIRRLHLVVIVVIFLSLSEFVMNTVNSIKLSWVCFHGKGVVFQSFRLLFRKRMQWSKNVNSIHALTRTETYTEIVYASVKYEKMKQNMCIVSNA